MSITPFVRRIGSLIVRTVYPRVCAGCGMRGPWVCDLCEPLVPTLVDDVCARCTSPITGHVCRGCSDLDSHIVQALACYPYTGWVADAVQRVKYRGEWSRAEQFAIAMSGLVRSLGPIDGLVPVPLHDRRFDLRGFNQAEELAKSIADIVDVRVTPILERIRDTPTQVNQDRLARIANMDGAFRVRSGAGVIPNGRYVLIDDVRTSGATVNACARAIAAVGSTVSVHVVTVALDIPQAQLTPWLRSRQFGPR